MVLTEETIKGGEYLNQERMKNSLKELPLILTNIIFTSKAYFINDSHPEKTNKNFDSKISSSYFRNKIYSLIPEDSLNELHNIWNNFNLKYLKISEEKILKWFNICRDYYTQSWRKYHSFYHIYNLIKLFQQFSECMEEEENVKNTNLKIKDEITVFYSIIFHDIIYTPSRNDNEEVRIYLSLK